MTILPLKEKNCHVEVWRCVSGVSVVTLFLLGHEEESHVFDDWGEAYSFGVNLTEKHRASFSGSEVPRGQMEVARLRSGVFVVELNGYRRISVPFPTFNEARRELDRINAEGLNWPGGDAA